MKIFNWVLMALVVFFSILVIILYSFSRFVTVPGSVLIFFILAWMINRKLIIYLLFPGSSWCWKRHMESNYCKEMSVQVSEKINSLQEYIQSIIIQNVGIRDLCTENWRGTILSLLENYAGMQKKLSKSQKKFHELLKSLQSQLELSIIVVNGIENFKLWDWIEIRFECPSSNTIHFLDTSEASSVQKAVNLCTELQKLLENCYIEKNFIKKAVRWVFNDTIGNIDYMRADLKKRFNCEEILLKNGKILIDW